MTFFPANDKLGRHTHQALIALFAPDTGEPLAIMDGRYITETRTAAASALATRTLAAPGAREVAIIGTGVQARAHVAALAAVMEIEELRVWGRNPDHAAKVVESASAQKIEAAASASARGACRGAHVICTVTSAREPVIDADDVAAGAHLNAVGFSGADARELPSDLVGRARLFVDSVDGAMNEAGDIRLAIRDGTLPAKPQLTLLCDVIAGNARGRLSADDITVFESLGIALEDLTCAALVYERAKAAGAGKNIAL